MSSGRDEYRTPPDLFAALDAEFHFSVDLAADSGNTLHPVYRTGPCTGQHGCYCGLCVRWEYPHNRIGGIWCNPPYSDLRPWVKQFARLADGGNVVVALLPVDPTTDWWAAMVETVAELRFCRKRVNFVHSPGCDCDACKRGVKPAGNNKGSVIAIWLHYSRPPQPVVRWGWTWKGPD